jgi:hypothetical protein
MQYLSDKQQYRWSSLLETQRLEKTGRRPGASKNGWQALKSVLRLLIDRRPRVSQF